MSPTLRKLNLTIHVASSVGWLGAVVCFLALSVVGLMSGDEQLAKSMYLSMNVLGLFIILPLCCASLLTGVIQSLGTPWGLVRYYWVATKLVLTVLTTLALVLHQFTAVAKAAQQMSLLRAGQLPNLGQLGIQLVADAAVAAVVLVVITTLGIFKPWGKTRYGQRLAAASSPSAAAAMAVERPAGFKVFIAALGLIAATFVLLHLAGGGLGHHRH